MKISQLVKRTGVPKETIHFYIREGLLRKPRKSGVNAAEYNESYVDRIRLIKDLRDNFYLPIPEIKKIEHFGPFMVFIYFCFYLIGVLLIVGGGRKVYTYLKQANSRNSNTGQDVE